MLNLIIQSIDIPRYWKPNWPFLVYILENVCKEILEARNTIKHVKLCQKYTAQKLFVIFLIFFKLVAWQGFKIQHGALP